MISISYSVSEHFLTFYDIVIFDMEAIKLLAQGVTILSAAGDAGVSGDGVDSRYCGYNPVFPASSIYVTAVGGTSGDRFCCSVNLFEFIFESVLFDRFLFKSLNFSESI